MHFEASSLKLRTTVIVLTEDIVSVDAPRESLTNVPFPTKGYYFSVKIRFVTMNVGYGLNMPDTETLKFIQKT